MSEQKLRSNLRKKKVVKQNRTEIVQVRLNPRLRFSAELAAKAQKRSMSSFLEWSLECNLANVPLKNLVNQSLMIDKGYDLPIYLSDLVEAVWDSDEVIRFVRLAQAAPLLLSDDERRAWEFIRDEPLFWRRSSKSNKRIPFAKLIRAMWDDLQNLELEEFDYDKLKKQVLVLSDQDKKDQLNQLKILLDELYPPDK